MKNNSSVEFPKNSKRYLSKIGKIPITNKFAELLSRVTYSRKNKNNLQNIHKSKNANTIKQLKLGKKK